MWVNCEQRTGPSPCIVLPEGLFLSYRVRDNRPLEVSPGVVSQPKGVVSEPAGKRDSPSSGDSSRAWHKPRNRVSRFIQLQIPSWLIYHMLIRKVEEPKRIPRGSIKLIHSGPGQIVRPGRCRGLEEPVPEIQPRLDERTVAGRCSTGHGPRTRVHRKTFFGTVRVSRPQ